MSQIVEDLHDDFMLVETVVRCVQVDGLQAVLVSTAESSTVFHPPFVSGFQKVTVEFSQVGA